MHGHKKYVVWNNILELQSTLNKEILPKIPKTKFKLKDQIERAVGSSGANFIEGYYSDSTKEFVRFSRYSRRSLAELEYWVNSCFEKGYIEMDLHKNTEDLIIRTGCLVDRLILSLLKKQQSA